MLQSKIWQNQGAVVSIKAINRAKPVIMAKTRIGKQK